MNMKVTLQIVEGDRFVCLQDLEHLGVRIGSILCYKYELPAQRGNIST